MPIRKLLPLLAAATFPWLMITPATLHADGAPDLSFNVGAGTNDEVDALAVQGDSKIIIAGKFTTFDNATANYVARLNTNGSLDTTFNVGLGPALGFNAGVNAVALQSDGKVIVGGPFDSFNETNVPNIVRLNPDGSVDTTFNIGIGPAGTVNKLAVDSSDRIYVAGDFIQFDGLYYGGLARLNPDGSLDPTFNYPATGGIDGINTILPQADGTVFIGGNLVNVPNPSVQRLNADGSAKNVPLVSQNLANGAIAIGLQSDGKILVAFGGSGSPYAGQNIGEVLRLNPDGSLDNTFPSGSVSQGGGGATVECMLIQPDDKILLGAAFGISLGPDLPPGIARLNSDGSADTSFDPGEGASSYVYALALDPSGRIVLGGAFSEVGGASFPGVARLLNGAAPAGTLTATIAPGVSTTNEDGSSGPATFIVSLSAPQSTKTVVNYTVKGSAIPGFDYQQLSGKVRIKPGQTSKTISVFPVEEGINDGGAVKVKVILQPGNGYALGATSAAKVKIIDND